MVIKGLVQVLMIGTMGLVFIASAGADTIYVENNPAQTTMQSYALGGTNLTRWGAYFPYSVGWTQTGTYSNVSISADVNLCGTGSSFLTTQVGAGTTVANEIASGIFTGPSNCGSNPFPSWVTMFTGLTLGPGTYFLTLNGDAFGGGWRFDSSIAPALGSGVTAAGESWGWCDPANTYETCSGYAPADTVFVEPLGLRVDVEGTQVPDAASACKNDGWQQLTRADGTTFKNQGDCIQYVNTGK